MARSSRRLGAKMPGVSMKTSCASPSVTTPRIWARVVCALWVTIDTLVPTSELSSVDLPALGAPTSAMKPQRVSVGLGRSLSLSSRQTFSRIRNASAALCSASFLDGPGGGQRVEPATADGDGEFGRVVGAGPLDFVIGWRFEPPRLRPFLQRRLGVGARGAGRVDVLAEQALDELDRPRRARRRR